MIFYANYMDMIRDKLEQNMMELYKEESSGWF